jgi:hypothetical protein
MPPPPVTVIVVVAPVPAWGVTTNVSGGEVGATVTTAALLVIAVNVPLKFCCETLNVIGVSAQVNVKLFGVATTCPSGAVDVALHAMTAPAIARTTSADNALRP